MFDMVCATGLSSLVAIGLMVCGGKDSTTLSNANHSKGGIFCCMYVSRLQLSWAKHKEAQSV